MDFFVHLFLLPQHKTQHHLKLSHYHYHATHHNFRYLGVVVINPTFSIAIFFIPPQPVLMMKLFPLCERYEPPPTQLNQVSQVYSSLIHFVNQSTTQLNDFHSWGGVRLHHHFHRKKSVSAATAEKLFPRWEIYCTRATVVLFFFFVSAVGKSTKSPNDKAGAEKVVPNFDRRHCWTRLFNEVLVYKINRSFSPIWTLWWISNQSFQRTPFCPGFGGTLELCQRCSPGGWKNLKKRMRKTTN